MISLLPGVLADKGREEVGPLALVYARVGVDNSDRRIVNQETEKKILPSGDLQ